MTTNDPLNRTYVELKCIGWLAQCLAVKTLNRTYVELKSK